MSKFSKLKSWKKICRLIKPGSSTPWWLTSFASSSCAIIRDDGPYFDLYITGRDEKNRSRIGRALWNADEPDRILSFDSEPCLDLGINNSFYSLGTSYPSVIAYKNKYIMFFTGWKRDKNYHFINKLGVAIYNEKYKKYFPISKNPIFDIIDEEKFGTGTSYCFFDNDEKKYKILYSSFSEWLKVKNKIFPQYHLKSATEKKFPNFERPGRAILDLNKLKTTLTCRPSLNKDGELFFCSRSVNSKYSIYSATKVSKNSWIANNKKILSCSNENWDNEEQCYPFVFQYNNKEYMLYSGNGYGKGGLGIAWR